MLTDGWDENWVTQALKTKGHMVTWDNQLGALIHEGDAWTAASRTDNKDDLVEVIWAYVRTVDDDDIPEVCCTVFCPSAIKDNGVEIYAKHGPSGYAHGKYPFVEVQQERVTRRLVDSRGVPEVAATWQDEVKTQSDMLADRTQLEINPTLVVPNKLGAKYRIGPGIKVRKMFNETLDYLKPPTGNPQLAFEVIAMVQKRSADYWGLPHPQVLPAKWQARLQQAVENFLAAEEEVCVQTLQLAQQYLTPEEMQRIGGGLEGFPTSPQDIAGEYDFQLVFDARSWTWSSRSRSSMRSASSSSPMTGAARWITPSSRPLRWRRLTRRSRRACCKTSKARPRRPSRRSIKTWRSWLWAMSRNTRRTIPRRR